MGSKNFPYHIIQLDSIQISPRYSYNPESHYLLCTVRHVCSRSYLSLLCPTDIKGGRNGNPMLYVDGEGENKAEKELKGIMFSGREMT